jgi:cell division FtsZ-interacting protein ZapD
MTLQDEIASLKELVDELERDRRETLASLPAVQHEAVKALIAEAKADTDAIVAELVRLRKELRPA